MVLLIQFLSPDPPVLLVGIFCAKICMQILHLCILLRLDGVQHSAFKLCMCA